MLERFKNHFKREIEGNPDLIEETITNIVEIIEGKLTVDQFLEKVTRDDEEEDKTFTLEKLIYANNAVTILKKCGYGQKVVESSVNHRTSSLPPRSRQRVTTSRPTTGYQLFQRENGKRVNPDLTIPIYEAWAHLDPDEKEKYRRRATQLNRSNVNNSGSN